MGLASSLFILRDGRGFSVSPREPPILTMPFKIAIRLGGYPKLSPHSNSRKHLRNHPKSPYAKEKEGCDQGLLQWDRGVWQPGLGLLAAVGVLFPATISFPCLFPIVTFFFLNLALVYLAFYNICVLCHISSSWSSLCFFPKEIVLGSSCWSCCYF